VGGIRRTDEKDATKDDDPQETQTGKHTATLSLTIAQDRACHDTPILLISINTRVVV
jgi:hypothetical protein